MATNELFQVGEASLEPGVTLIEASAGTGKTYAIAGAVVRLIAEKDFPISAILLVTYTEAATRELRDRVRSRIRDALGFLASATPEKDEALRAFRDCDDDMTRTGIRRLRQALLSFDEAAIFTIHGFCQRMLRENAFETGVRFEVELVTDPAPLWRETVQDFWRRTFYPADGETGAVVAWLGTRGRLSTDGLLGVLTQLSRHPDLAILADADPVPLAEWPPRFFDTLAKIREVWRSDRSEIEDLLKQPNRMKKPYRPEEIDPLLAALDRLEAEKRLRPETLTAIDLLAADKLAVSTRKGKTPPSHPFFDQCEEASTLLRVFEQSVRAAFIESARERLAQAKRQRNVMTFDDLLTILRDALESPGGERLAEAMGHKFRAVLIDEFQDTDPVQWEIFRKVFGGGRHLLFLIGDPKQAIYAFRGADIFTYLEARRHATRRCTLGTNWRSDGKLVEAANEIFRRHSAPFVFPEIVFSPVAASRAGETELDFGENAVGINEKPLQLVCVSNGDGPLNTGIAKEMILELVRDEICRLLTAEITRNGKPLEPADIAVLVRTNREADEVRQRLIAAGIPAVTRTNQSVLHSPEAADMRRFLAAVLEPHSESLVRGALAGSLFGWDAAAIHRSTRGESEWQEVVERFHNWQETWKRRGFIHMFRAFLLEQKARLLGLPDGERILTNFQHAAECIHQAEYDLRLTPAPLLHWLVEQGGRPDGEAENHLLRLEKDERAVQIVTIHRSKGLEYPVVFCPFNWTNFIPTRAEIVFHDPANGNRLTWDLRAPAASESKAAHHREQQAEAMRLLYVALTRARNRCYLFWAQTRASVKPENSVLAHLFQCGGADGPETPLAAFNALAQDDHPCLAIFERPGGAGRRSLSAESREERVLTVKTGAPAFSPEPLVTSFSGMTAAAHEAIPDRDALTPAAPAAPVANEPAAAEEWSIFSFPKGTKAGNFFHGIMEKLDFRQPETLRKAVEKELARYRFDRRFAPAVAATLDALLKLPLLPEGGRLADIGTGDRLVEEAFYYPILPAGRREIAAVFDRNELPEEWKTNLGRLEFSPVDGYMTGFIDLVVRWQGKYYIIDWKSNWLGGSAHLYSRDALRRSITESYYFLQYHLYTLALHRHLAARYGEKAFDERFGGVFYIFVRGIDRNDPSSGIYFDRPSRDLVAKLERTLLAPALRGEASCHPALQRQDGAAPLGFASTGKEGVKV